MIIRIAWRYFTGRKSTQAIQIISWVSVMAMAVGTAALIIVLSVFNGFEGFIQGLYSDFYPAIRISAIQGKTFPISAARTQQITAIPGVKAISHTLEEKVLLRFNESQVIANIKGIDSQYHWVSRMTDHVKYGQMDFNQTSAITPIVLGIGLSNKLGATETSPLPLSAYLFDHTKHNHGFLGNINTELFQVQGIFTLQDDIDNQYAFVPLSALQEVSEQTGLASSIEVSISLQADADKIRNQMMKMADMKGLKAETRYEQNHTLFFILKSERWAVFAILCLMLFIASFNIVGSLSMLVMDKERDIAILQTMGLRPMGVRNIFLGTGIILSGTGAMIGGLLALGVCFGQQYFGWVRLGDGDNFLIEAYPVEVRSTDFLLVMGTVMLLAMMASWYPAQKAARKSINLRAN